MDDIFAAFDESTLDLAGGFHRDFAPPRTALPFMVAKLIVAPMTHKYDPVPPHAAERVSFSIVGSGSASAVDALAAEAVATFATILTCNGGVITNAIQQGRPVAQKQSRIGPGNVDVWMAKFDVLYTTQETE